MARQKKDYDVDSIIKDLKDDRYTPRDVANKHNIPVKKIYEISSKHNINLHKKINPKHRQIIDAVQKGNLTRKQAAEKFGVSESIVEYACHKYGVKLARPVRYPRLADEKWLYQKLIKEQRTYREVAELIGCTYQRVQQRVCELGWQDQRKRRKRSRSTKKQ